MSSAPIVFSAIKTHAANKKIEQDSNGYYKVILGALNTFNSSGAFYVSEGVRELVNNKSSLLSRRLSKGYLNGEMGHPQLQPGMDRQSFILRNMRIDQSNISHHIRDIMFTPTNDPSGMPGKGNTILIEGWVKPTGPKGQYLKDVLDNPDQNVAFSIRALTFDKYVGGLLTKKIEQIITWDWVVEPGIATANKWDKLSMEGLDLCMLSIEELKCVSENISDAGISTESADIKNELISTCNKIQSCHRAEDILTKW